MKTSIDELAVFGGVPALSSKHYVGRPNIGNRERLLARFNDMLDRRWLTNDGPYVQEFEQKLAQYAGVRHCIPMCNATIALEIAIRALGMSGEVIVPSFTFVATAHALQWQEITPVFCDIDPRTHLLDPEQISRLVTPRTTGIIGVHLWGQVCDTQRIEAIAREHGLRVLYDAAHAFGCAADGRRVGGFGDAEVYSFHATKFFNSFEGGAVATNDDALAERIRLMKNFGFSDYDKVTYIGTNGKMTEIAAAMGITSLESLDEFVAVNKRNYEQYLAELSGLPGLQVLTYDARNDTNYQYIVLEIDEAVSGISRDRLQRVLWAENVIARRYFYPGVHRMEPYRSYFPHAGLLLPETERMTQRVLCLPSGTGVDAAGISTICQIIRVALANSRALTGRLEDVERGS